MHKDAHSHLTEDELMILNSSIAIPMITGTSDSLRGVSANTAEATSESILKLAKQVEQARVELSRLLKQNQFALDLLAEQFLSRVNAGVDISDLALGKFQDHYIVQADMFVQLDTEGTGDGSNETARNNSDFGSDINCNDLSSYHFLPAFLIEVAAQVLESKPVESLADLNYKHRLFHCQQQLQNLRQQMIVKNTGLVAFAARRYKTTNLSFDDVMQEGLIGLIKAVDRFDPDRAIRFSTYAIFWIKQAVSRLIVKQEKIVRLPVALAEKASALLEIIRKSYLQNERWPSWEELHGQSNLSESDIKTLISYYQATHSLDAALQEDGDDLTLMDQMQQQQFALPLNALIDHALTHYLDEVIASLPEKEASILIWRFGLKNHAEMTLQAVADQLQVTRERVRQIQNEALKKLKQQFGCELRLFLEANDS